MTTGERALWLVASLALLAVLLSTRTAPAPQRSFERPRAEPGVRLSMRALHQSGGVPLAWQPTLSPGNGDAGRADFVELGCHSCHRVRGESFPAPASDAMGPELTGMGSHHPPAYFAEAVLNPDAVLIDEPGYIGKDGHSIMPAYPDMTLAQLSDLVAYLTSLIQDDGPRCHDPGSGAGFTIVSSSAGDRPEPPPDRARTFFTQTYDVLPDRLHAFETWFSRAGRQRFLEVDGLLSVETFVDLTNPAAPLTTVVGFRDEAALRNFLGDPGTAELWAQFDGFVGSHGHHATDRPLVYRAPTLSIDDAS